MELNKQNLLFFTRTMGVGGTENVVLQLCEIMKPKVNTIIVCSCGGINVKKLQEYGIKHYEIPDIEVKNVWSMLKILIKLLIILTREKVTIVHTHHRMAAFYMMVIAYVKEFKFVNTAHNTFNDKRSLTRFAYSKAKIIAVGNKVKDNLCEYYGIPDEQVTVIHNAIKPFNGQIEPVEIIEQHRREGKFLVGNIGRLSRQKGVEYFVKAIPKILIKCPHVKFIIVGEGEEREKIINLILELGLEDDVILLGYRNDVQNIMSQLDLIVLSSLWEGLPLTPIEAFSVGKTVIATSVDGTVEIIQNGENGLLIQPKNCEEIATSIIGLITNKALREELEHGATITYNKNFNFKILEERYIRYYMYI